MKETEEKRGCELLYLPYSPYFSPIEEAFSKVKGPWRKAAARSWEALVEAIGAALAAVGAQTHEVSSSIADTTSQPNYHDTCLRLPLNDALNSQPSGTKENNPAEEERTATTAWKRWS